MNSFFCNSAGQRRGALLGTFLALWMMLAAPEALAQAPAASGGVTAATDPAQLDLLVGPIALYPDDLVGIILPGSTYPIEIVQADRFLDKRKNDKNLKINDAWHDSIKSLLNYPDVVKKMSTDLDWTTALGEAVVADQGGVLEAIQRFRRQVKAAGNLKSDDKQTIVVEKEVIQVVQANPEVIYVPQYNPSTIVVAGGYPSYGYYPAPYPVYYYPYPPGAALATGLIWGAAITAAWNGGHYATHYGGGNNNINVNRNTTINTGNINTGNVNRSAQGTAWKSEKQPGQVSGAASRPTQRTGDLPGGANRQAGAANAAAGGARPATQPASRPNAGTNDRASSPDFGGGGARQASQPDSRPSAGSYERGAASDRGAQSRGGDAFGGYDSGRNARADSSRGAASRESMSSSARGQSFQGGGGRSGGGGRGGRR